MPTDESPINKPALDYEAKYLALREKHNRLVMRLEDRAEGSKCCLAILAAYEAFLPKRLAGIHLPGMFLREALKETLVQMSKKSPLLVDNDHEGEL
jgi:hypothetical protein